MTSITDNLIEVRRRIDATASRYCRDPATIRLVAASKLQPVAAIETAAAAGQKDFAENTVQEAIPKIDALPRDDLIWHFIGVIQANKTRTIADRFDWVHTVSRYKIARRLSEQRSVHAGPLQTLIQVLLEEEPGKSGVAPKALPELAEGVSQLPNLQLRGLMCIPPPSADPEVQRQHFKRLREELEDLNRRGHRLDTLSMGMSADLEAAIAEGATIVRVGTAIFGPRPVRSSS